MSDPTQEEIDSLKSEVLAMATGAKLQKLEADIKSRSTLSLGGQKAFLERVRAALEAAEVAEYAEPTTTAQSKTNSNGYRKPDASNPFSAAGWNKTKQAQLVTRLGREAAEGFAKSAGVTLGSTKPNPLFN